MFAWLRWVDATFSTYRPDSEISRLDRGERFDPHPLVREVLARCEELRVETGGWFDARAGGRLDPSGYVKGWAVERAAAFGRGRFLIDAGGDVVLRGEWRVGIRHPYERDRLAAAITVVRLRGGDLRRLRARAARPRSAHRPAGVRAGAR